MTITITASEKVLDFLRTHENESFKIIKEEKLDEDTYNANFTNLSRNDIVISVIISVFSPFVTDLIKDCINEVHEEIVLTTEEEQYVLNRQNIKETALFLNEDISTTIKEKGND